MIRSALAAATAVVLLAAAGASAEFPADRNRSDVGDALVAIDGWRYVRGPNDLHVYVCDHSDCGPGSRVICHMYPDSAGAALAPGQARRDEDMALIMLGVHRTPGVIFAGVRPDFVTGRPHGVATAQDGTKEYYTYSMAIGSLGRASLISSSSDEKKSEANIQLFEVALKTVTR